jgi:hypothetical protein
MTGQPDQPDQPDQPPRPPRPPRPRQPGVVAAAPSELLEGGAAFPAAAPSAPSFADEIATAVSYERALVPRAVLALALVLLVLAIRLVLL